MPSTSSYQPKDSLITFWRRPLSPGRGARTAINHVWSLILKEQDTWGQFGLLIRRRAPWLCRTVCLTKCVSAWDSQVVYLRQSRTVCLIQYVLLSMSQSQSYSVPDRISQKCDSLQATVSGVIINVVSACKWVWTLESIHLVSLELQCIWFSWLLD